jgi:hypothetical protein
VLIEPLPSNDRKGYIFSHRDWWEGFMKHAFEMGSGAMIYVTSIIKIGAGIQNLIGGDIQHGDCLSLIFFKQGK